VVRSPDPHAPRSPLEEDLCAELKRQSVPHEHRSLHFRVHLPDGHVAEFTPDLVIRRGVVLFLLEPLTDGATDRARLELLERFLDTHSPEIVLVIVTASPDIATLPPASYDEAYPSTAIVAVVRRIREQDPKGLILPFKKPASIRSSERDLGRES
jgi:hypothetical protein